MLVQMSRTGKDWLHYSVWLAELDTLQECGGDKEAADTLMDALYANGELYLDGIGVHLRVIQRVKRLPGESTPELLIRILEAKGPLDTGLLAYYANVTISTVSRNLAKIEDQITRHYRRSNSNWRGSTKTIISIKKEEEPWTKKSIP